MKTNNILSTIFTKRRLLSLAIGSLVTVFVLSLSSFIPSSEPAKATLADTSITKKECSHCVHKREYDNFPLLNEDQPPGYINEDSSLMIFPILDFAGSPGQTITTLKVIYRDGHFCSGRSAIKFYLKDDSFLIYTEPYLSCRITIFPRLTADQIKLLKTKPIEYIRIVNLTTYNTFNFKIEDPNYFINTLKLDKEPIK